MPFPVKMPVAKSLFSYHFDKADFAMMAQKIGYDDLYQMPLVGYACFYPTTDGLFQHNHLWHG